MSEEEKIKSWLRCAILAPSAHNTQPWRCKINGNALEVYRDPKYTLKDSDPTLRETFIGLGAFVENFIVAAGNWGYQAKIAEQAFLASDLLAAKIQVVPSKPVKNALFDGAAKRHTNRGIYDDKPLGDDLLAKLGEFGTSSTKIFVLNKLEAKKRIAELVKQGTKIALSMRPMAEELASLVFSKETAIKTGMLVGSMVKNQNDIKKINPDKEAEFGFEKWSKTPVIFVVGTLYDGPTAWLEAGRVMERILLFAATQNMTHDIAAAPVEIPTLAPLLRREIDPEYRPQVLLRIGKPVDLSFTKSSPRRGVEKILE